MAYKGFIIFFLLVSTVVLGQRPNQQSGMYFKLGETAFNNDDWVTSEAYFDSCLQIDPLHFNAHYSRAISRENQQKYEYAINDYSALIHLDPEFTEALWSRATLSFQIEHYELAYEDFKTLSQIPENETNAVFFSRKYPDPGVSAISTLETMRGQIFNYMGMTAHELGRFELALAHYDEAIGLDSLNADIYVNRSQTQEAMKNDGYAINDLRMALQLDPDNTMAIYNLARLQEKTVQSKDLVETYTSILEDNPEFAEAYAKRGLAKMNEGDLEGALQDYDSALYYDETDALKWMNRGIIHMKLGYLEHAYSDLSTAIDLKADMENAYLNRGNALMKLERYEEAKKDYDMAIFYYPEFAMAYYNRGIANNNLDDKDLACQDLQTASDLGFEQAESTMVRMGCR